MLTETLHRGKFAPRPFWASVQSYHGAIYTMVQYLIGAKFPGCKMFGAGLLEFNSFYLVSCGNIFHFIFLSLLFKKMHTETRCRESLQSYHGAIYIMVQYLMRCNISWCKVFRCKVSVKKVFQKITLFKKIYLLKI